MSAQGRSRGQAGEGYPKVRPVLAGERLQISGLAVMEGRVPTPKTDIAINPEATNPVETTMAAHAQGAL